MTKRKGKKKDDAKTGAERLNTIKAKLKNDCVGKSTL